MNKFTDCHLHIHDSDREAAMRFLDVVAECGFKNYKSLINYFREAKLNGLEPIRLYQFESTCAIYNFDCISARYDLIHLSIYERS